MDEDEEDEEEGGSSPSPAPARPARTWRLTALTSPEADRKNCGSAVASVLNEPLHDPGDRVAVGVACALREGLELREGLADFDEVAEAVAVALAVGTLSP